MDDDNGIVEDGLYRIVSYIDKSSQVGKVLTVFHFLGSAVGTLYITFPHIIGRTTQCSIFIPKHPRTDFIAYLNPLRSNSCRFQRIKYIGSMVGDGFLQVGQVQSFPCSRLMLLSRVGPPVTVMEVYHYVHAQLCGTLGFRHQIGRIAPVIVFFGIDPYSELLLLHANTAKAIQKKKVKNFMCFMALSSLIAYCKYKHLGNIELHITLICQNTGVRNRLHKLTTR